MGYIAEIAQGIEVEFRRESVIIYPPDDDPEIIGGGEVEIGGDFLARIVTALYELGLRGTYDRGAILSAIRERDGKL